MRKFMDMKKIWDTLNKKKIIKKWCVLNPILYDLEIISI